MKFNKMITFLNAINPLIYMPTVMIISMLGDGNQFFWRGCCLEVTGRGGMFMDLHVSPTCDPIHHMVFSDVDGKVCN